MFNRMSVNAMNVAQKINQASCYYDAGQNHHAWAAIEEAGAMVKTLERQLAEANRRLRAAVADDREKKGSVHA